MPSVLLKKTWYLNGSPFLYMFLAVDTSGCSVFITSLYALNVVTSVPNVLPIFSNPCVNLTRLLLYEFL